MTWKLPTLMSDATGRRTTVARGGGGGGGSTLPRGATSITGKSTGATASGGLGAIMNNKKAINSSGGGSSSGGSTYVGSGVGSRTPAPSITPAPKVPTYYDLNPSFKAIFDNLKAFNPDYDSLKSSQQVINDLYAQQIGEARDYGELQQQRLATEQERLYRDSADARSSNLVALREGRQSLREQMFDLQRQNESALASRGLGDSGAAQLAGVQAQMASGDATSDMTSQYYELEEQLQRNLDDANENYQMASNELNAQVQSAVTSITQSQAQSQSEYQKMVESIKMQVQESANQVEMMKSDVLNTQFQNEMARTQFETQQRQFLAQFQEQQRQFDAQMASQAASRAQSAAQADRSYKLQKDQMEKAASADMFKSNTEKIATVQSMIDAGYSKDLINSYVKDTGINNLSSIKQMITDNFGGVPSSPTSNKNNKVNSNYSIMDVLSSFRLPV